MQTAEGKLRLFVAIDRTSKFAFVELHQKAGKMNADLALRPGAVITRSPALVAPVVEAVKIINPPKPVGRVSVIVAAISSRR